MWYEGEMTTKKKSKHLVSRMIVAFVLSEQVMDVLGGR